MHGARSGIFGYGKLTQMISQMSTRIDPTTLVSCAIIIALAVVATVLLRSSWALLHSFLN
jgi:hypothetical protein